MKLFNTETQQIEHFQPLDDQVILYAIGRKPVEEMELSHLFLYSTVDVLARYLEMQDLRTDYVQIIADPPGQPPSEEWARQFTEAMSSLNMCPPDYLSDTVEELETVTRYLGRHGDIRVEDAASSPAQTESAIDQSLPARIRLQTAAVNFSTSTGDPPQDPIPAEDMLRRVSSDAVRIYLAQHHYRSSWTYDQVLLEKAAQHAERLSAAMNAISTGQRPVNTTPAQNRFKAALDNDLDTAKAIATLLNCADEILFRAANDYQVDDAQAALRQMASVFGLRLDREQSQDQVIAGWHEYHNQIERGHESTGVD